MLSPSIHVADTSFLGCVEVAPPDALGVSVFSFPLQRPTIDDHRADIMGIPRRSILLGHPTPTILVEPLSIYENPPSGPLDDSVFSDTHTPRSVVLGITPMYTVQKLKPVRVLRSLRRPTHASLDPQPSLV